MHPIPPTFGLDTFGDVTNFQAGEPTPYPQVIRDVVAEAELADQVGLDFFGVGEHHRADFAVSAPEVVLAAAAARTTRIRLGSAVTVLSSDEPVRVFQRFATLDAVAGGRAVGRRLSWAGDRSPNPSRSSACRSTSMSACSTRSWTCSCGWSARSG